MKKITSIVSIIFSFFLVSQLVMSADLDEALLEIQREWATANYQLKGDSQNKTFTGLVDKSNAFVASNPNSAEALIWNGIVLSTYAGIKGGVGALKYAKQARKSLESAIKIDATALDGSAYTSLGTLYYKVPGFPIGFGSKKKAEKYLIKALEINPNGIDPNYFYGDFLIGRKRYAEAVVVLNKAMAAPSRPQRPIADKGRREEISKALSMAQSKQ